MVRRKERQAGETVDVELELEQDQTIRQEEDCVFASISDKGDTQDEVERDVRALDSGVGRSRSDTMTEAYSEGRSVGDKQVRDLLLHVSQSVSQISGALGQVVSVIEGKSTERESGAYRREAAAFGRPLTAFRGESRDVDRQVDDEDRGLAGTERVGRKREREGAKRRADRETSRDRVGLGRDLGIPRGRREELVREQELDCEERLREGNGVGEIERRDKSRDFPRDTAGGEGRLSAHERRDIEQDLCRGYRSRRMQTQTEYAGGMGRGAVLDNTDPETGFDYERGQVQWGPGGKTVKIPPFSGKEEWKVWIKRFEIIAYRQHWTKDDKLDNLIQRLEGKAAEFAFAQLPHRILNDYGALVGEITNRYRKIETPRTFAAEFSSRSQKNGETVEDYAAELKRLYDRAHGYRDATTRQEDLVRRFLDGLWDEEARFDVEFHKDPATIDEAVYFVACYLQTKGRINTKQGDKARKPVREAREMDDGQDEESSTHLIGRVPEKTDRGQVRATEASNGLGRTDKTVEPRKSTDLEETQELLKLIAQTLDNLNKAPKHTGGLDPRQGICYNCNEKGHRARECPKGGMRCYNCGEEGHMARECTRGRGFSNHQREGNQNFKHYGNQAYHRQGGHFQGNQYPAGQQQKRDLN